MIVAAENRDIYEDFEPSKDTFFFKIGSMGKISFYGRNYNITKQLSAEQRLNLTRNTSFVRISSNCYVNVDKISAFEKDQIRFIEDIPGAKCINVPIWKKMSLRHMLSERKSSAVH